MVLFGLHSHFFIHQTRRVELKPNSSTLVSSDHSTFSQAFYESFRGSLANLRRACTCAFLSKGTSQTLQDFSPITVHSVTNCILGDWGPRCRVVLTCSLPSLIIIIAPWGEILHGAPHRGHLMVILCVFHFQIMASTVVPSFGLVHGALEIEMEETDPQTT